VPSPTRTAAVLLVLALAAPPAGAAAQSLLDRTPNVSGAWVGNRGQLYFNFLHRFTASSAPERKVINVPTFTVAAGLPFRTIVGAHYATNSQLAPRYPNEWEVWARHAVYTQDGGAPLDLAGEVAYNFAADGVDGELSVGRRQGPLRLLAAGRILSDPLAEGETRMAVAGGATLRITRYLALAGDVATLLERTEDEKMAWGAGLHIALPHTPHTLSLQAANTNAYTLQGSSRGESEVRYGFEFTIPVTLARWFGGGGGAAAHTAETPAAPAAPTPSAPATGTVVKAGMRNLAYTPARIEVAAGTTVEWTNGDALAHTVTAANRGFDSGLIQPGQTWRHTFATPGTYDFNCTPHPFMKGVVIVK
jgi:plastocyanin